MGGGGVEYRILTQLGLGCGIVAQFQPMSTMLIRFVQRTERPGSLQTVHVLKFSNWLILLKVLIFFDAELCSPYNKLLEPNLQEPLNLMVFNRGEVPTIL